MSMVQYYLRDFVFNFEQFQTGIGILEENEATSIYNGLTFSENLQ